MAVSDYQMIQAWQQVLKLSNLEKGQTVTILTGSASHPQTLATALIAVQSMGAIVNRLDLPPVNAEKALSRDPLAYLGTTPITGNKAAIAMLKKSDLVLDLMTLLFSPEQMDILKSGTKILLAVEPPEILVRTVPTEADRTRVKKHSARLAKAKEMYVVSDAGIIGLAVLPSASPTKAEQTAVLLSTRAIFCCRRRATLAAKLF